MRPRYCCFYLHQRLCLGWAKSTQGDHLSVVLADGSSLRQRGANLLYAWDGAPAEDDAAALAQLQTHSQQAQAQLTRVDALYAAVVPGQPVAFEDLATQSGASAEDGWARGLLFSSLLQDSRRWRYSKGAFTARSPEEVAAREAREQREAAELAWAAKVETWRTELEAGTWQAEAARDTGSQTERTEFLDQLQSILALEKRSPHWTLVSKPLGLHNLHLLDVATRIKGWLRAANAWPGWPSIWLQWAEVPRVYPPALRAAADRLAAAPPRAVPSRPESGSPAAGTAPAGRRTWAAATVYTLDSEGTRDYDDGYAVLEADERGVTVAMHIAEPDPVLLPGHPLFDEAARRMSTVYTLDGIFPMFPEALSTGRFSLVAGAEREVLTFILRIEASGGRLLDVRRDTVTVAQNLDYTAGQRLLDEDPERWGRLALACAGLADLRAAQGAVIMVRRDTVLDVSDPQQIRLAQVVRSGPVHQLVEELAILYNREAGRYCRDHRLPAIYRVQPQPRRTGENGEGPERPMAARFSTRGGGHAGLACDRYIQATSPIRRFPDVLMQRQIAEHATTGRVTFTERAALDDWAERADTRLGICDELTRRIAFDWKCRYLLQNRQALFDGVVQRGREGRQDRVWLEPLHLLAQCALPASARDGDTLRVRVESIDRDHQVVWAALAD